ncbi:VHS1112 protein [Vibrio phage 1]|nr:VHS1112 protein [Vibrio phage 1]
MQRMIARQEARKEAERLARESLEEDIANAEDYIKSVAHLIAPGDIFVCRGFYDEQLLYHIDGIYIDAPSVERRVRIPLRQVKVMVNYRFFNVDSKETAHREFPLSKFLNTPVHANNYRVRVLRPLRES